MSLRARLETLREIIDSPLPSSSLDLSVPPSPSSSYIASNLEHLFTSHHYGSLSSSTYDQPLRKFQSLQPEDFLKAEYAKPSPPVNKQLGEKQWKQQQVLLSLQRCHKLIDRHLKDQREPEWVVKQLQRITSDLSLDFDASGAVVFGTKGEKTGFCFMAEINLSAPPSLVENAAVTYLIGNPDDLPAPCPEASEELRTLIIKGDVEMLELKLTRIRAFENLLLRHPDASLFLSLSHVENAFSQLIHASPELSQIRLLEGPALKYFQLPLETSIPYCLTFLGPIESTGEAGLRFPFQFELQPPLCMEVSFLARLSTDLLGLPPVLPHHDNVLDQAASLHRLLSVCDEQGNFRIPSQLPSREQLMLVTMPDGFKQTWISGGAGMFQRGVLVSRLTMHSLEHLAALVKILKQQAMFNHLYRSVFGSATSSEDAKSFELQADPPTSLRIIAPTFTLTISTAEVHATVESVNGHARPCSDTYATRILQTCLNIPLTLRFISQKNLG